MRATTENDVLGLKFGRWLIVGLAGTDNWQETIARARCECGTERNVRLQNLKTGKTKSCGCLKLEIHTLHGDSPRGASTPEYRAWTDITERCENPNNKSYKNYGGRGITVCARWRVSYEAFLADMGRKPSAAHSIDRINNDGNYEPGNCRWATRLEQARNRRPLSRSQ